MRTVTAHQELSGLMVEQATLGRRWFYGEGTVPGLVTGNETNTERVFGTPNEEPYTKDGIDRFVVHGDTTAVDPNGIGTKAALHCKVIVPARGSTHASVPPHQHRPGEKEPGRRGWARSLILTT